MSHYHVKMSAVPGDHPHTIFYDVRQAREAARGSATTLAVELRKSGHRSASAAQDTDDLWTVEWDAGRRTVEVVACDEPLDLRPAEAGNSDT